MRPETRTAYSLICLCCWAWTVHAGSEHRLILQTTPLAGFQHYPGAALFPLMQTGDALHLRREPDNPHDAKAVRVEWHGVQIGYVPRAENVDLARLMDRGTRIDGRILHLQKSRNPWQRVLMEIYVQQEDDRPTPNANRRRVR
jgi:hypothetical protein